MTKKVMNISLDGCHLECIRSDDRYNPYRVYKIGGGHRRQIAKYGDFLSVLWFLQRFYTDGVDTMSMPEVVAWAKKTGSIW